MKSNTKTLGSNRAELEQKIEKIDSLLRQDRSTVENTTVRELIESLQVYQAELEIQNQELNERNLENTALREHYHTLFHALPMAAIVITSRLDIIEQNLIAKQYFSELHRSRPSLYSLVSHSDADKILNFIYSSNSESKTDAITATISLNGVDKEHHIYIETVVTEFQTQYLVLLQDISLETEFKRQTSLFLEALKGGSSIVLSLDLSGNIVLNSESLDPDSIHLFQNNETSNNLPSEIESTCIDYARTQAYLQTKLNKLIQVGTLESPDVRWYNLDLFPLSVEGQVFGAGCIISDSTEHVQRERYLKLAVHVFDEGTQGLFITDQNRRIVQVNRAYENITGQEFKRIEGSKPQFLNEAKYPQGYAEELWEKVKREGSWEGELWCKRNNGAEFTMLLRLSAYPPNTDFITNYVGVCRDITDKKFTDNEITRLKYHDSLTGCGNRRLLQSDVQKLATDSTGQRFAIFLLDLDFFAMINDIYGHDIGDQLLKTMTARLLSLTRAQDKLYRIGGDEFVFVASGLSDQSIHETAKLLLSTSNAPFLTQNRHLDVTLSVGVSRYPEDGSNFQELLKYADAALNEAKTKGRKQYRIFSQHSYKDVERKVSLEYAMRVADLPKEFFITVMPQLSTHNLHCNRAEILLRWRSPDFGSVGPNEFIPIAENSELIHKLTGFVLEETFALAQLALERGLAHFKFSLNVSAYDLMDDGFFQIFFNQFSKNKHLASNLRLELTESIFVEDFETIAARLHKLKAIGLSISIDDFGTGYSSMAYLRELPIDEVKIDKTFIDRITENAQDHKICLAIISLAESLSYDCVAEGVETEEQLIALKNSGCQYSQGFLHSEPLPVEQFIERYLSASS